MWNRREALFKTVPVGGHGGADDAEIRLVVVVVVLKAEGDDVVGGGGRGVVNLKGEIVRLG